MFTKSRLIYVSQFLSSWGDRMWSFAVALFLMDLAPESLLLPAIYGLATAASVLMFGPLVGNWIDRTPRLRAARTALVIQNSSVATCAVIFLVQKLIVGKEWGFLLFVKIIAIVLGVIARLASVGSTIIIQKDWIVVVAGGDEALLSQLNSVLRRLDLFTKLLAPLVCGQVITLVSLAFGCGFVAGWNVISMFIEYFLLHVVYKRTPALAHKASAKDKNKEEALLDDKENPEHDSSEEPDETLNKNVAGTSTDDTDEDSPDPSPKHEDSSVWVKMFGFLLAIPRGWKQYMSQSVAKAGIGLSFLYMTVLGFDSITNSYAYNQCFSELLVGILLGAGGVSGIVATFSFAPLAARIGIIKTGLLGSLAQVLTLVPCVLSVFVIGSPFFLLPRNQEPDTVANVQVNVTLSGINSTIAPTNSTSTENENVFLRCIEGIEPPPSYLSLSLLMTGIVLARIGLWGFDLAVTQVFQQNVPENERGVVGGVQNSLNCLMDLLHFVLVIILPHPEQFGLLVILSAVFVTIGHFLYALYARQELTKKKDEPAPETT